MLKSHYPFCSGVCCGLTLLGLYHGDVIVPVLAVLFSLFLTTIDLIRWEFE